MGERELTAELLPELIRDVQSEAGALLRRVPKRDISGTFLLLGGVGTLLRRSLCVCIIHDSACPASEAQRFDRCLCEHLDLHVTKGVVV